MSIVILSPPGTLWVQDLNYRRSGILPFGQDDNAAHSWPNAIRMVAPDLHIAFLAVERRYVPLLDRCDNDLRCVSDNRGYRQAHSQPHQLMPDTRDADRGQQGSSAQRP